MNLARTYPDPAWIHTHGWSESALEKSLSLCKITCPRGALTRCFQHAGSVCFINTVAYRLFRMANVLRQSGCQPADHIHKGVYETNYVQ
jgi:hypothetical protein